MTDLSTVKNRDALKPRPEPYWHRLAVGHFLGYRPSAVGTGGNWIARYYDSETRKQQFHAMGDFGRLPPNERFTAASSEAREWFQHLSSGGSPEVLTVREACELYAASHPDAARRFPRYVYNDPIAKVTLRKLTEKQVRDWRRRLEATPALVTRSNKGEKVTRARAPATVNRDMVPFRAALNLAWEEGLVTSQKAWKRALEPVEANGRRDLYLDRQQRRELLKHMTPEAVPFALGMCLLPLRPGAMAHLEVGHFDARRGTLRVERDKANAGRTIPLSPEAVVFLKEQARLKHPAARIFIRANGKEWSKDSWKGPFKAAAVAAGLPVQTTAYSLRHTTITDLVQEGLPLLSVAQISGTSVRIIEKHYGHLQQAPAVRALSSLAL